MSKTIPVIDGARTWVVFKFKTPESMVGEGEFLLASRPVYLWGEQVGVVALTSENGDETTMVIVPNCECGIPEQFVHHSETITSVEILDDKVIVEMKG